MIYYEVVEGRLSDLDQKLQDQKWWAQNKWSELRSPACVWGICMCVFYVFLYSYVQVGATFCVHLLFLADKTVHKQFKINITFALFQCISCSGTKSHWQSRHHGRTDSTDFLDVILYCVWKARFYPHLALKIVTFKWPLGSLKQFKLY